MEIHASTYIFAKLQKITYCVIYTNNSQPFPAKIKGQ